MPYLAEGHTCALARLRGWGFCGCCSAPLGSMLFRGGREAAAVGAAMGYRVGLSATAGAAEEDVVSLWERYESVARGGVSTGAVTEAVDGAELVAGGFKLVDVVLEEARVLTEDKMAETTEVLVGCVGLVLGLSDAPGAGGLVGDVGVGVGVGDDGVGDVALAGFDARRGWTRTWRVQRSPVHPVFVESSRIDSSSTFFFALRESALPCWPPHHTTPHHTTPHHTTPHHTTPHHTTPHHTTPHRHRDGVH